MLRSGSGADGPPRSLRVAEAQCTGCRRRGAYADACIGAGPWVGPGPGGAGPAVTWPADLAGLLPGRAPGGDVSPDSPIGGRNRRGYDAFPAEITSIPFLIQPACFRYSSAQLQ